MGEAILLEAFRLLTLARDDELVAREVDVDIPLTHTRKDGSQVEGTVSPTCLKSGAKDPTRGLVGTSCGTFRRLPVDVIKHLVDRTPEVVQRLPNIVGKGSIQHRYDLQYLVLIQRLARPGRASNFIINSQILRLSRPVTGSYVASS